MKPQPASFLDDGLFQPPTNTLPAEPGFDIERGLAGICVSWPVGPWADGGPTDYVPFQERNQNRMPLAVGIEPRHSLLDRPRLGIKGRGCRQNCLVVNLGDSLQVSNQRMANLDVRLHSASAGPGVGGKVAFLFSQAQVGTSCHNLTFSNRQIGRRPSICCARSSGKIPIASLCCSTWKHASKVFITDRIACGSSSTRLIGMTPQRVSNHRTGLS